MLEQELLFLSYTVRVRFDQRLRERMWGSVSQDFPEIVPEDHGSVSP